MRHDQPENSATVVFLFLPYVAYKRAQDHFAIFSFRFQELESVQINGFDGFCSTCIKESNVPIYQGDRF